MQLHWTELSWMYNVKCFFNLTFSNILFKVKCPCLSSVEEGCAITEERNKWWVSWRRRKKVWNKRISVNEWYWKKKDKKIERKRYLNHPQFWSKDPTPTNPWDGKSLIAFTLWLIMAVTTCLTANKQFWTSSVPPIIATGALYII